MPLNTNTFEERLDTATSTESELEWKNQLLELIKSNNAVDDFIKTLEPGWQNQFLNDYNETPMMAWIHYRRETPPKEFIGDTSLKNFMGNTALMYWCIYTDEKNVPDPLMHDIYITNDEGMVVSMVYMEHRGKEPPHELIVNPVFKDNKGRTQAMHFLINCFGTLPEIFMHDIYIADNNGNTLEYYSVVYNHRYDPRFEISNLYKNAFGDTLVMALIENFGEDIEYVPEHMYHDPKTIVNNNGRSYDDLKRLYKRH